MPAQKTPSVAPLAVPQPGLTVQTVIDALIARMASGDYTTGARMPSERALARELGVARNTVREALDHLDRRGMIRRPPGAGAFVTYDPTDMVLGDSATALHVAAMRSVLEPEIARLAVVSMSSRDLDELSDILSQMETATTDARAFGALEEAFRRHLVESTRNALLVACNDRMLEARRPLVRDTISGQRLTQQHLSDALLAHRSLFDALVARCIRSAQAAMTRSLSEDQLKTVANP